MTNKYNNWIYRSLDIGLAVNGNGNIEMSVKDDKNGREYILIFSNADTEEEIIERIGTEIYSWIILMQDQAVEDVIEVDNFGNHLEIYVDEDWFVVYHDDCIDFSYDENLQGVIDEVAGYKGRELTDEEKQMVEEKVGTWIDAHSCEDDEYYDKEEKDM